MEDTKKRKTMDLPTERLDTEVITIAGSEITVTDSVYTMGGCGRFKIHNYTIPGIIEGFPPTKCVDIVVDGSAYTLNSLLRSLAGGEKWVYEMPIRVPADVLFRYYCQIKNSIDTVPREQHYAYHLLESLTSLNKTTLDRWNKMFLEGVIEFEALWYYFENGSKILYTSKGHLQGAEVYEVSYYRQRAGAWCTLKVLFMTTNGKEFYEVRDTVQIQAFEVMSIEKMDVRLIKPDEKLRLEHNGKKFAKYAKKSHYLMYDGQMVKYNWYSYSLLYAKGRVMIDTGGSSVFNRDIPEYERHDRKSQPGSTLNEEDLYRTENVIKGFSFSTKRWGEFFLEDICEIEFNDKAFDYLVMGEKEKRLISALVKSPISGSNDIISGKGGGCIFLLHGPPGVGKTLTAESIAETLHKPLYSVSVGELGTKAEALEGNLRRILDLSQRWKAVLLIDEADIFLQQRTETEIERNAMVAVFLRLLEYHEGVLFLTTNRVKCFDEAFSSRINVSFEYKGLDVETRKRIWASALRLNKIEGVDIGALAESPINGRQIRNVIAMTLKLSEKITTEELLQTISVVCQFGHAQ